MNPIIPDIGMSDPHLRVHDGRIWLFTGHDQDPDDETWVMPDWRIYSSTDLVDWREEGVIDPSATYLGAGSTDCWAGDAIHRDGRWWWYCSDHARSIGVSTATEPAGPWSDPVGGPLAKHHDPTVVVDEHQQHWLIWGAKDHDGYQVAPLADDMVSFAAPPRLLRISGAAWDEAPMWMDKNYAFTWQGRSYLSWGSDYAVADRVDGDYVCAGSLGSGHGLGPFAHGSFVEWRGQFYHIWCRYLREGFKYRECLMSYCHRCIDGSLHTDTRFLDQHGRYGVGHYRLEWPRIDLAWYNDSERYLDRRWTDDGHAVLVGLADGDHLAFDGIIGGCRGLRCTGQSADPSAHVEVRVGNDPEIVTRLQVNGPAAAVPADPQRLSLTVRCADGASVGLEALSPA